MYNTPLLHTLYYYTPAARERLLRACKSFAIVPFVPYSKNIDVNIESKLWRYKFYVPEICVPIHVSHTGYWSDGVDLVARAGSCRRLGLLLHQLRGAESSGWENEQDQESEQTAGQRAQDEAAVRLTSILRRRPNHNPLK